MKQRKRRIIKKRVSKSKKSYSFRSFIKSIEEVFGSIKWKKLSKTAASAFMIMASIGIFGAEAKAFVHALGY